MLRSAERERWWRLNNDAYRRRCSLSLSNCRRRGRRGGSTTTPRDGLRGKGRSQRKRRQAIPLGERWRRRGSLGERGSRSQARRMLLLHGQHGDSQCLYSVRTCTLCILVLSLSVGQTCQPEEVAEVSYDIPIRLQLVRQNVLPTERTLDPLTSRNLGLTRPLLLFPKAQEVKNTTRADGVQAGHHLRGARAIVVLLETNWAVEALLFFHFPAV